MKIFPNGTYLRLFNINFSTDWLTEPNCTETDLESQTVLKLILKSPGYVPFVANLTQFGDNPDIHGVSLGCRVRVSGVLRAICLTAARWSVCLCLTHFDMI